jgi:hypothetical protein
VHIYCGDGRAATGTPTLSGLTANVTDSEYFHIWRWRSERPYWFKSSHKTNSVADKLPLKVTNRSCGGQRWSILGSGEN